MAEAIPCPCGQTSSLNSQTGEGGFVWRVECKCGVAGPWRARQEDAACEWSEIVTAYNMHDRLVAYVQDNMPKCMHRCKNGPSCDGCDTVCEEGALLKEARATNLPGLTDEESALVREHKAEIARGDK